AASQIADRRLELPVADHPVAQKRLAETVLGDVGRREDELAVLDVDGLRDFAARESESSRAPWQADRVNEVGAAQPLEPPFEEQTFPARIPENRHCLMPKLGS